MENNTSQAQQVRRPKIGRSHRRDPSQAIPIEQWGRDHWTTLLYIETRIVDHRGIPDREHMRCDQDRHPFHVGLSQSTFTDDSKKYPTRLKGGVEKNDHDDWDCVEDMVDAGILVWEGTGANPFFSLTEKGHKTVSALRRHYAENGRLPDNFVPPEE